MQKLQDSVFSVIKTTGLSPSVFKFLQPSDSSDNAPLGGILSDTNHGWLALGSKFCVVDLRSGLKIAARIFGVPFSNSNATVTSVVELPTSLTENSKQLVISLECDDLTGLICIFHVNGSQILQCIQTDVVITELTVCDETPDGLLTCFDGVIMAGSKRGEIFAIDLNRAKLIQALKDVSQGYEHLVHTESNPANLTFMSLNALEQIEQLRDQAIDNDDHLAIILNETSLIDGQYLFRNPDGTVRMKAKRDHIRVSSLQYIPQLGSLAVGYNFGAFQIWNMMTLDLEFTSQVNRECLPVTHFGFQEPCDDPRAFCYLWAVFSALDRYEEEEFPLVVMYSLTYQGKRMLSDTKCLYQEFMMATIRFQVELGVMENAGQFFGGRCVSCHTYSIESTLGEEGEDSMLNICQLVWECWGENTNSTEYGMLLFDLDQWYKDQMPATYPLQSNTFMSASWCGQLAQSPCRTLDVRLEPTSVAPYSHATRLEEHFYPNSLHYSCVCLSTSDTSVLTTIGIQRQILASIDSVGPTALLRPTLLYSACVAAGLTPLYHDHSRSPSESEQRRYLLSVALEAKLSRFLKRCAHDWATGSHNGVGCTLPFLVDWCWKRAIELKENAKDLTAPLFYSSSLPDRNVVRCLEHCVQQLSQLTGLLDAILTKCCNLVVPDALSEIEEKYKGVGTVSLYFQVVQWFLRVGLLPERHMELPYPAAQLYNTYSKRRLKLHRLQENALPDNNAASKPCSLLYIDQLLEHEFGGENIYEMWLKGGSETNGLYPPPSLYSLLRLYLLPDIAEEHKHSLVLYLLVDYSMVYDEVRYEAVIRRLMQFPTMFGLSNTAIKATQAFWHLDHRDFDFALDQLQCLTGNTLSEWQHHVVLSSLLAQKKTQAALQYLHVRKPAPIQNFKNKDDSKSRVNDHDKLEDWQSCCNLYLARELVYEALDVVRMCVQNATSVEDKLQILNFFFKGCRNTGQLSKILQVTLLPFEEEAFIKYLENCNDPQTSEILVMYYIYQARYLEAQEQNNKLKQSKRVKDVSGSMESVVDVLDRESARDTLVQVVCSSLPPITNKIAQTVVNDKQVYPYIHAPKPMSVYIQARSPKQSFKYKSTFIQDTIENASETWVNRPNMRRVMKRALNVEETPFICTPKLSKTRSFLSELASESTPPKRPRMDLNSTPRTPRMASASKLNDKLNRQMATLLDMPEVQRPDSKAYDRSGAGTPHSILKIRRDGLGRDAPSPVDSRYLGDSDDELLETGSNHTHYSDSTNKHLRFTIPTASESGSTPSPQPAAVAPCTMDEVQDRDTYSATREKEMDVSTESYVTTTSTHGMKDSHPFESPPKKMATEEKVSARKSYKDNVRARRSLSISANSSLSDDPNTSIESIADIPITLINPRYVRKSQEKETANTQSEVQERDSEGTDISPPRTPKGRKGIRSTQSTPSLNRSRSVTPEHKDSPIVTPLRTRNTRSRSRTPEISPRSSPLDPILEQPKQEIESEPHAAKSKFSAPMRQLRSRSRTPERIMKVVESPRLEAITESPNKSTDESPASPQMRLRLRSRSRTPEVEIQAEIHSSPRSLRSRSKTPEKLMSPKTDRTGKSKKSLSRIVLEANTFTKAKTTIEKESEITEKQSELIESTPMKTLKQTPSIMDVSFSPIASKSILQSFAESPDIDTDMQSADSSKSNIKPLPKYTKINETQFGKSVLQSCDSSVAESSQEMGKDKVRNESTTVQPLPPFTGINESYFTKSVLHSYESSMAESSESIHTSISITNEIEMKNIADVSAIPCKSVLKDESSLITNDSDINEEKSWKEMHESARDIQKEKERIVEIEREINEIEGDMSDESGERTSSSDEEIIERVNTSTSGEDSSTEEENDEGEEDDNSMSDNDDEVISIGDSSTDSSSDPSTAKKTNQEIAAILMAELNRKPVEKEDSTEQTDPLNQAQVSLMTDDNSVTSEKSDIDLNYSDDKDDGDNDDTEKDKPIIKAVEVQEKDQRKIEDINVTKLVEKEKLKDNESQSIERSESRLRARTKSTSSNKSAKDSPIELEKPETIQEQMEVDKSTEATIPRVPITRKRAKSNSSNKSVTEEDILEPTTSKSRVKTPEVRKILTRRASKELENLDDAKDVESPATPQRRLTRARSKNLDDNASVTSEGSVKSTRSKTSEKSEPVRKGRKSILVAKPELSAIPELSVDDSKNADLSEYSSTRRLTRHQKSVLATLESKPAARVQRRRRTSASDNSIDDDASSTRSTFDVQPIDRISLLNKQDFEGSSDTSELPRGDSPDSIQSDLSKASKSRKPRMSRAASESKSLPKAARAVRRVSVDIAAPSSPARGSPAPGSPARVGPGRRASFNRACDALLTPKGSSVRDTDSQPGSPAGSEPATPVRRTRRASTQSATGAAKPEQGKRSKKTSIAEESTDSKKK